MNKFVKYSIICIFLIFFSIIFFILSEKNSVENSKESDFDKFGTLKIYPSKLEGSEWYIDMENPTSDVFLTNLGSSEIIEGDGDSLHIERKTHHDNEGIRLYVVSPQEKNWWKNVEITGYVNLESYTIDEEFSWVARSGRHNENQQCEGTAYYGAMTYEGENFFQKEIFHGNGGYADKRFGDKKLEPLKDRWVGLKFIVYNLNSDKSVNLEFWVDNEANNNWIKFGETLDNGGWSAEKENCFRDKDYIISEARPLVGFRADNASFDFKNFSIREIDPGF